MKQQQPTETKGRRQPEERRDPLMEADEETIAEGDEDMDEEDEDDDEDDDADA
jgi:hypothetical protein